MIVNLIFKREEVPGDAIEFVGPAALARGGILQTQDDANFISLPLDCSLNEEVHTKLSSDLLEGLLLINFRNGFTRSDTHFSQLK